MEYLKDWKTYYRNYVEWQKETKPWLYGRGDFDSSPNSSFYKAIRKSYDWQVEELKKKQNWLKKANPVFKNQIDWTILNPPTGLLGSTVDIQTAEFKLLRDKQSQLKKEWTDVYCNERQKHESPPEITHDIGYPTNEQLQELHHEKELMEARRRVNVQKSKQRQEDKEQRLKRLATQILEEERSRNIDTGAKPISRYKRPISRCRKEVRHA